METITIHFSRKDTGILTLLAFIMFGASLFVLLGSLFTEFPFQIMGLRSTGLGLFAGVLGTIFFGYGFIYLFRRFLFPKNALIINAEGIINRTNALGMKEVIPFTIMKKAVAEKGNVKGNIGIELHDEKAYLEQLPWLKRKTTEINHNSFGTSIISLDVPVDSRAERQKIIDIINERIQFYNQ